MNRLTMAGLALGLLAACGGVDFDPQTDRARGKADSAQVEINGRDVEIRDGDLVFQDSKNAALRAITLSRYTHVGLVLVDRKSGDPWVLEAYSKVELTPLEKWIARGKEGHVVIKRLRDSPFADVIDKLWQMKDELEGLPYNGRYLWEGKGLYCSQLVYKVFERFGIEVPQPQTFGELMAACRAANEGELPPAAVALAEKLFGGVEKVPEEQPVITPVSMMNDTYGLELTYINACPKDGAPCAED